MLNNELSYYFVFCGIDKHNDMKTTLVQII